MSLTSVTIGSHSYPSYSTANEADAFLAIELEFKAAWTALVIDVKCTNLAAATRFLDALRWAGERADDIQTTEWPRKGLLDAQGEALSEIGIPDELEQATILLAAELALDPMALSGGSDADVRSEQIGPKSVTYVRRRHLLPIERLFPNTRALAFVRRWLAGSTSLPPVASGTDAVSAFDPPKYGRTAGVA